MTVHVRGSATQSTEAPFSPSWIDRLPGPAWIFYVLSTLAIAILGNALFWIDGSLPFGSIDRFITIFAIAVLYWLALHQYLTQVGSQSLKTFGPLLAVDDTEFAIIDYELATLPRWLGWLAIPLGIAFAAATILGDPAPFGELVPLTALPYVGDIVITGFLVSTFFCLIIRSIRQLRMVHKIHAQATNINLLKLKPVHAFSALTARTGIGVLLVLIFAYLLEPQPFGTGLDIITYVVTALLSIAVFVIPVIGMQGRLEEEKQRVLNETSDLLKITSASLHSKINDRNYDDLGGMETAISALIRERELLEKIPTWPWDPRTIRGFASALLLPIFLWLVTRLLESFL
ncbi:MAG: hypothetical protein GTO18_00155 [Anaerolineales bacterium]|nr:hypothetical protein [Anaerolineales bacterium]